MYGKCIAVSVCILFSCCSNGMNSQDKKSYKSFAMRYNIKLPELDTAKIIMAKHNKKKEKYKKAVLIPDEAFSFCRVFSYVLGCCCKPETSDEIECEYKPIPFNELPIVRNQECELEHGLYVKSKPEIHCPKLKQEKSSEGRAHCTHSSERHNSTHPL